MTLDPMNDRFLMLDVMGEQINVLKTVAKKIPFLDNVLETKTNDPVIIDLVSPEFFKILVEFIKNDKQLDDFKTNICCFKEDSVDKWLKYLGMDELHKLIFGCRYINKKLVIEDSLLLLDSRFQADKSFCVFTMCDGNHVTVVDPENTLVHVSGKKCLENANDMPKNLKFKDQTKKQEGYIVRSKDNNLIYTFFSNQDIIEEGGLYFISFINAVKYNIISNRDFIKKIYIRNYPNINWNI